MVNEIKSVIVFHITRADADESNSQREHEERVMSRIMRKLLPVLRRYIRREDTLNLRDGNTLVIMLNADRPDAELLALRLKHIIASQHSLLGKHSTQRLLVRHHVVSFVLP